MWNGYSSYKKIAISGVFNAIKKNIIFVSVLLIFILNFEIYFQNTQKKYNFTNECFTGNTSFEGNNVCYFMTICKYLKENIRSKEVNKKAFAVSDEEVGATISDESSRELDKETEKKLLEKIDEIFEDIDSDELDEFLSNDFNFDFFSSFSFSGIVKKILSGLFFSEYDSLFYEIVSIVKNKARGLVTLFLTIFSIVVLSQLFVGLYPGKYIDIKKVIEIILSFIVSLTALTLIKNLSDTIFNVMEKMFSFSEKLFPILLGLTLVSGAKGTHTVYSGLSVFLSQTGGRLFAYILFPISLAMIVLSIFSIAIGDEKVDRLISLLKSIFKYISVGFISIFGLFSGVNIISSGISDGLNFKLTKFAIKSYVPVIGNYISDGFDFVKVGAVLVKNSFGICGVFTIVFMILSPIIFSVTVALFFRVLSALSGLIGEKKYAGYFEKISQSVFYFIALIVGEFFCIFTLIYFLIISVSVL